MRWLAVRLDVISVALISITALMIVLMHGQIPPAYAGLAISYAVQVRGNCLKCIFHLLTHFLFAAFGVNHFTFGLKSNPELLKLFKTVLGYCLQ